MFDQQKADHAVKIISMLYTAVGKTLCVEMREFLSKLYGTVNADATRQFAKAFFSISRQNGKSTLVAAMLIYHLCYLNEIENPEMYIASTSLKQAAHTFNKILFFVNRIPELNDSKHLKIVNNSQKKELIRFKDGIEVGKIVCVGKTTVQGYTVNSICLIDELCDFTESHRELWNGLHSGALTAPNVLYIITTTANSKNAGLAYEQYQHAKKVMNGQITDDSFFPFIIEADPNKWADPKEWERVNPAIKAGYASIKALERAFNEAKIAPESLNNFKRKHLNIYVGSSSGWVDMNAWRAQQMPMPTIEKLKQMQVVGAMDLSRSQDFSCLLLLFFDAKYFYALPYFFLPEAGILDRTAKDSQDYASWLKNNLIITSPGTIVDYQKILDKAAELKATFPKFKEICYDPALATHVVTDLEKLRFQCSPVPQTFTTMGPLMVDIQRCVAQQQIVHDNPILDWQMSNFEGSPNRDATLYRPSKSNRNLKIDGAVCLTMALGLARRKQAKPKPQKSLFLELMGESTAA